MTTVLMISPGFPADMPHFTIGLAAVGARILGVGDQSPQQVPGDVQSALSGYLHLGRLWDEDHTVDAVAGWLASHNESVDRVECLWEPGVVLAAKLRARLGVAGISVDQAIAFRDKETMKATLDAAGIRTPHHYRATTKDGVRESAERIGFPVVIKPIDGAGSADTYTAENSDELEAVLPALEQVPEVSVEEYIDGEEYTYDTICANGQVLFENVAWYRPKPLVARLNPWISPAAICLRDLEADAPKLGVELGRRVIDALGFDTGVTHMEWFLTPDGEAVFGEIGARAPGGRLPHGMNMTADIDVFAGWGEALCSGGFSPEADKQFSTKKYNVGIVFKRAVGNGSHISRIEGLESVLASWGEYVPIIDMVPPGQPRRDWRQVVTGDGWMLARHPNLDTTLSIVDRLVTDVRVIAD